MCEEDDVQRVNWIKTALKHQIEEYKQQRQT